MAVRVETTVEGFPDLPYCLYDGIAGLLELKVRDAWPVRPSTPVRIPHFTHQQKTFLEDWVACGGDAGVLLRVGKGHKADYLLFHSRVDLTFEKWTKAQMLINASRTWLRGEFKPHMLTDALTCW
jgi:hypothetical protein